MASEIQFYKYQGAGNDFILIDDRKALFDKNNEKLIRELCDRRFGVGGDGLMLLQDTNNYDFRMRYFNADGKEGTMCGNGGRCLVAFARDLDIIRKEAVFLAVDGRHEATIENNQVRLGMVDVDQHHKDDDAFILNTGSPHYVCFVDELSAIDVNQRGAAIRNQPLYREQGINVNFVQKEVDGYSLRTFERGVEAETFACGTGAVASAMSIALQSGQDGPFHITIRVLGGVLAVEFNKTGHNFSQVYLSGPAEQVFQGSTNEI
ncbi:MAG: diaminopimelate epimerase [Sphingobacterium sp.]